MVAKMVIVIQFHFGKPAKHVIKCIELILVHPMLNMGCIDIIGRRVEVDKKGLEPARGK